MTDNGFDAIVADDVRGSLKAREPEKSEWLRHPDQLEGWQATLLKLKRDVQEQFSARKARLRQIQAEYLVAKAQRQKIDLTRVVLDINGTRREVSDKQADVLMRKAQRHDNAVTEVERYVITVDTDTAWVATLADEEGKSANALQFLGAIERDLAECKILIRAQRNQRTVSLLAAIANHRDSLLADELNDVHEADETLWRIAGLNE